MSYSPPNTFADGTTLTSNDLEGNFQALRVYLHKGIVTGDLQSAKVLDTQHVQPPEQSPITGLQHGVTGYQGGQWAGGAEIRLTFATKYLSGQGRPDNVAVHHLPQAAFTLELRRTAYCLFHYWFEVEVGPDVSAASYQETDFAARRVHVIPYIGDLEDALSGTGSSFFSHQAQEIRNGSQQSGSIKGTSPIGASAPFTVTGGYGSRQGTVVRERALGTHNFGLAVHSLAGRAGVVNWGIAIEAFYL